MSLPWSSILDDGKGMTEAELLDAMRDGTGNPRQYRSPQDLGRFGLGLKTASFSQCRSLTVVSTRDGAICGAEWNLDCIDAADDWILSMLDEVDIRGLPYVKRLGSRGMAVIWRERDLTLSAGIADETTRDAVQASLALEDTSVADIVKAAQLHADEPSWPEFGPRCREKPENGLPHGSIDLRIRDSYRVYCACESGF